MINKFLDPKTDIAFKRIFGSEKNKDILIDFLNAVLKKSGKETIVDVTYLSPIQDPEIAIYKTSIVDILCEDASKIKYIVEMQVAKVEGFEKRAQYYAAKAYCSQMKVGGLYEDLKEVIFLAIADHSLFPYKAHYISEFALLDKKTFEQDLKGFSFTFVELKKFNKKLEDCHSSMDQWFYFLIHAEESKDEDVALYEDPIIAKAYDEVNRYHWTEEELMQYEEAEKRTRDLRSSLEYSKNEGIEIGTVKGIEIGTVKGIEIGENKKAIEIAKTMLAKGLSIEMVREITGLDEKDLASIKAEVSNH